MKQNFTTYDFIAPTDKNSLRPERSELLMPAGSLNKMKTAILYGADAIYVGTPDLSLRTKSAFSLEDLIEGIELAHKHGKRVYLTINLFTHNRDMEKLPLMVETIKKVKPDGVIIADPAVFQYIKDNAPELELHISTQANICSWMSVKFWEDQGASLCVLAREVSFDEFKEIREKCPNIKIEGFIHGAMCMTYSGRCLLSNYMSERGANQGNCAHSCRWNYKLHVRMRDGKTQELVIDETNRDMFEFLLEEGCRPGELMEIEEDNQGSYILNSKDLCILPKLPEYLSIGLDSLKVEGRHKNEYYVAVVARAYRKAIDDWYNNPEEWSPNEYMEELEKVRNRGYTLAFHEGTLTNHSHDYGTTASLGEWSFGGIIREWDGDEMIFELKNALKSGDVLVFLPHDSLEEIRIRLYDFTISKNGEVVEKVSAGQKQAIRIPASAFHAEDAETLKKKLCTLTVARCETLELPENNVNSDASLARVKVRIKSHQAESGKITTEQYEGYKKVMAKKTSAGEIGGEGEATNGSKKKLASQEGASPCCGRGCNGCLNFWNDDKYAKARDILAKKKQGLRLTVEEKLESEV